MRGAREQTGLCGCFFFTFMLSLQILYGKQQFFSSWKDTVGARPKGGDGWTVSTEMFSAYQRKIFCVRLLLSVWALSLTR